QHLNPTVAAELGFLGQDNLPNRSAVENLLAMGKTHIYAHTDSTSGLDDILTGVTVEILGPPTLEQTETIRKERSKDPDEFWQLHARFWGMQSAATVAAADSNAGGLFPKHVASEL